LRVIRERSVTYCICQGVPQVPNGPWISNLSSKDISFTDIVKPYSEVDILVDSDLWGGFMTGKELKLTDNLIAKESELGWTLSGPLSEYYEDCCSAAVMSLSTVEKRSLKDLWSLETLGIRDAAEKISQEEHDFSVMKDLQQNAIQEEEVSSETALDKVIN